MSAVIKIINSTLLKASGVPAVKYSLFVSICLLDECFEVDIIITGFVSFIGLISFSWYKHCYYTVMYS